MPDQPASEEMSVEEAQSILEEAVEIGEGNAWAWDGWSKAQAALARLHAEIERLRKELDEEIQRAIENGLLAQKHWDRAEAAEAEIERQGGALRAARLDGVNAVLRMMQDGGKPRDMQEPGAIVPHTNGYACWFIDLQADLPGTYPLSAEEILRRYDEREAALAQPRQEAAP